MSGKLDLNLSRKFCCSEEDSNNRNSYCAYTDECSLVDMQRLLPTAQGVRDAYCLPLNEYVTAVVYR